MKEKIEQTLSSLKILYILSGITVLSAIVIPTFYIDFEIATEMQWGFQYFLSLVFGTTLDFDLLANSSLANLWKGIYGAFNLLFLVIGCVSIFNDLFSKSGPLAELAKSKNTQAIENVFSGIRFRFVLLTLHFFYSFALCFFVINGKSFSPVITFSFIPFLISFFLFGFGNYKRNEYLVEIKKEVEKKDSAVALLYDQMQLFLKYQELYDGGALSKDEFEAKKQEVSSSVLNIKLTTCTATEQQTIFILKQLKELEKLSGISSDQFSEIKNWLYKNN